jgi:hypothetical protein
MGSVGALLVKLISAAGARILHDFLPPAQQSAMRAAADPPSGRYSHCVSAGALKLTAPTPD